MSTNQIIQAITNNQTHPSQFILTQEEFNYLNQNQDDLFDKLNHLNITFIESSSDTIMTHLIIAQRIKPTITINEFIGIYTNIKALIQG